MIVVVLIGKTLKGVSVTIPADSGDVPTSSDQIRSLQTV